MPSVVSPVLLEPIPDGQLRGHASDTASMLFGPNGCTKHILNPLGFEFSLLLKLGKLVHFLCHCFGLRLVKCRLAIHYLRLSCLKLEIATFFKAFKRVSTFVKAFKRVSTFFKAFKRVSTSGGYCSLSFTLPLIDLPLVSTQAKTDFIYVVSARSLFL
jgi:hypothetical protein